MLYELHDETVVTTAGFTYGPHVPIHTFFDAPQGNPYANAAAESSMKTLKCEDVYLWDYQTVEDV